MFGFFRDLNEFISTGSNFSRTQLRLHTTEISLVVKLHWCGTVHLLLYNLHNIQHSLDPRRDANNTVCSICMFI